MRLPYKFLIQVVVMTAMTIGAWITAFRMRRRIKRALGRNATETDLTSIGTWMKVDEAERRAGKAGP